jgi:hypothetical protein
MIIWQFHGFNEKEISQFTNEYDRDEERLVIDQKTKVTVETYGVDRIIHFTKVPKDEK